MEMPLTKEQALLAANWIETHFRDNIKTAIVGTQFNVNQIICIALQESGGDWFDLIKTHTPDQILALCVSDPSGDEPGTTRDVWPNTLPQFRLKYSDLADMLEAEGNKYRAMKGWTARPWLMKAYGIFQYDIEAIPTDREFFANKLWYSFDECLNRLMKELHEKYKISGDSFLAIERYNGAGPMARAYLSNIKQFYSWLD
jgi:hypothetical protein